MICCCISLGSCVPDLARRETARSAGTPRRARPCSRTSILSTNSNWWQATKPARSTRYADRIGRGLVRRCETVIAPDFFES